LNTKPFYKQRYFKFLVAGLIVIFIAAMVIFKLNFGYSDGVKDQAQKAFNTVDIAYKENRQISNAELDQLKTFETLRADREAKYYAGKASKLEENDATILHAVGQVIDEYTEGKSKTEDFKKKYDDAKILVK
jgi:hypothetical protein